MSNVKKIIKKLCYDLDVEIIFKLPKQIQDLIFDIDSPLANFYKKFLTYHRNPNYDFFNTIDCPLHSRLESSEDLETYISLELENKLASSKNAIDLFTQFDPKKIKFYTSCSTFLDQFKHYMKNEQRQNKQSKNFTNAWLKCWEMIHFYKLIPTNHSDDYTVFCNAEFPGAFVLAFNHYIKTYTKNKKYEWYANSIWPTEELKKRNKEIYKDSFKLYEKYPHRWLMNEKNGGDVSKINMIDIIEERLKHKVDLYTSDVAEDETHSNIILGQFLCGLKVLKNGGTMVCRMSTFFKPFSMSLLFLLTTMFSDVCITKPMASRAICSECYIIGKNYTSNPFMINQLETVLTNWTDDSVNTFIEPITEDFYVKLVYASYYIYDREIHFLKKNMEMTETMYNKNKDIKSIGVNTILQADQKEFEFRKGIIEHWKTMFKVPYLPKEDDI
jgi:hypothetical protein